MINKQFIKTKMPAVFNFVKQQPFLFRVAKGIDRRLSARAYAKLNNDDKGYTQDEVQHLLNLAKAQGLFDYAWYSANQCRVFSCEQEAFEDYLLKGAFSCVNPSPAFDTELYYKCNTDIYLQGEQALVHYLNHGKAEGRMSPPATPKWHPKAIATTADGEATTHKIAMCFHVFYGEFIDYYCNALAKFPQSVDVFVSVSSEDLVAKAQAQFTECAKVNNVSVKVVPNHGRNFGPMLVEFAQDLQAYDLFCHMHSKKSLYSGRAQTQWADYLGEYLLNDQHVIKQMLNHFSDNPNTGMYYPTSFWMMPNWVNHWLKNKHHAKKMAQEWDIELSNDFLAYPAGGMFWARPDALKQLLDKTYQYDDFPAEPLPNDGSELHALERMLGLLAEKNGYQQLFYYPTTGQFTHDDSYILTQYVNSQEGLRNQLGGFDHVSFDVFDTLVRRRCFVPDYAKLLLGKALVAQGVVQDAHQFVTMRNNAEFEVRQAKNFIGDVTIFEIYQQLASQLNWSDAQAKQYAEHEFAYDLEMIEPKDEMVDLFNELIIGGKQITVASDTYYTLDQVALMLAKVGVTAGYELLVSSELGKRKDNGSLWQHIKDGLSPDKTFIHVGDNAVADAQIPGDFGLQNMHILNPLDKWHAAGWQNPFVGELSLNEKQILKWGPLVSDFGRFPFLGE
ncbi:rhamnan synthesis F family protein [Shewanella saliphila]|uniref:Glycosyl transferase family 1 n=1 Tax=Shewanella saliphila TaxID=2282698 RepID=A0ABQ2Q6K2_9GAMM|nr:rhamnan synthesis F family protein [Shewanella saliphila]MCL1101341.1 glycosyl transferase family 1 [Shewanella saliphila]GGP50244.1 hypothetical protein GCM10009409_15910 [Shewanella saliphila]